MSSKFFLGIVEQLSLLLKPLPENLSTSEKFSQLLKRHGWLVEPTSFEIDQVRNLFDPSNADESSFKNLSILIESIIGSDIGSILDTYPKILEILQNITRNIQNLEALKLNPPQHLPFPFNTPQFWEEFPSELIDELLISYLESYHHFLFSILLFFGIIERKIVKVDETLTGRISYSKQIIRYENLQYITNPEELRKRVYGWGTDKFDFELFLSNLKQLLNSFGSLSDLVIPSSQLLENYYNSTNPVLPKLRELRIFILGGINEDNELPFDLSILVFPIPQDGDQNGVPVGIAILPEIDGDIPLNELGKLLNLKFEGGFQAIGSMRIEARPEKTKILFTNSGINKINMQATFSHRFPSPKVLMGTESSHNIKIHDLGFGISLLGTTEDTEVVIVIKIQKAQLTIDNSDNSIDSFIKDRFRNESIIIDFDCSLIYSSKRGLHFEDQSGLEMNIPINRTIGMIKIDTLTISIISSDKGINLNVLGTGNLKFGPVSINIENIGLSFLMNHTTTNEDDDQQKIFDDLFLDFGLRAPTGFGITLDSNGIRGGGFISKKESEYSGVIDLNIRRINVQAFALLDTRDNSFLFAIFSNLRSPIQLMGGWKITKIGGVIGIDRSVSHMDIASGIRSGILDSILFPDNVIQNAPRIISDLKRVFPTKSGQHLIGPAVKIAYGTPTLLIGDIALLLEFPNPFQLSAIGRIRSKIPNEENPVIQINLAILGAIDFANLRLGIYGSLYDSKILDFTLSGDMAMAASWGPEEKNFILSLGGFNPRFKPPSNFPPFNTPPLKRLTVAFSSYVSLQCYVALTSNTLQFGARVDALFKKGSATISGFLGFDALVQFVPLYFIVDVIAGFSVKYRGRSLASIKFSGFIEGPNPVRIKGSVTFSILWWDISIGIDKTFGIQIPELISSIDLWPILRESLEQNDSWTAELPTWAIDGIIVNGLSSSEENETNNNGNERLLVHPVGTLKVSQKIVPFNHTLTKFGTSNPIGNPRFKIVSLLDESTNLVIIQDYFAPAQFSNYDNTQKLSLKSFDLMDSGVMLGNGHIDISCPIESISQKQMIYETILIPAQPEQETAPHFPMVIHTQIFEFSSSAYKTQLAQNQNNIQYKTKQQKPAVSITNERYIILDIDKNLTTPIEPSLQGQYSQAQAINKLQNSKIKNKNNLKVFSIFEKPLEITI